jgi:16S rRNA (cytosine967-C5)-methyltransferase
VTPAARIQAAIEVLDRYVAETPVEAALTNWARGARYAGSRDRAAVRDLVFAVLRQRLSSAAWGGGQSGRALMIGFLRQDRAPLGELFQGQGHGPAPLTLEEREVLAEKPVLSRADRLDMPEWLLPELDRSLAQDVGPVCDILRKRAPVFLRVNMARATRGEVQGQLAEHGIVASPHTLSPSALVLEGHPRGLAQLAPLADGLAELQDAASQAVVDYLPVREGDRVLDYCAGGGGKSLAVAARGADVFANDASWGRMKDIPVRAGRAGVRITLLEAAAIEEHGPFHTILCDVPCSGSGAWRRSPEGKWALTQEKLNDLLRVQGQILTRASTYLKPGGVLAYATCSLLTCENEDQIDAFLKAHEGWKSTCQHRLSPLDGGDGFFTAHLTRETERP